MDSLLILFLALIVVAGLVLLVGLGQFTRRRSGLDSKYYRDKWAKIEQVQKMGEPGWQVAIIQADKLLDQALKERGFSGETMGDRLKSSHAGDKVWAAHKIRNRIAHEADVKLNPVMVGQALRGFKQGLKNVGAL
ncbi:MAG TPA: hypothetical protein VJM46_01520 [Candidatus Saccharimonadales bacterium]|nr:hypothetical protein [Candidatus Saccharimonadales bacterium]